MQTRHPATILVVEDDLLVRDMIVEILKEAGFAAYEAANAEEALRALAKGHIDTVVSDIDMPGEIDGVGLARRIGELKPEVGVILTSGRSGHALPPRARFLAKPFTARHLLQSVAALSDERLYAAS
jgi:two-component system, response regulator PdtaR